MELQGVSVQHSGPLPMVNEFAGYEQVLPGAADRILGMAEQAQASALESDRTIATTTARSYLISTVATSALPYALLGASIWLFSVGAVGVATVTSIITAVTVAPGVVIKIKNAFNRNGETVSSKDD